ncbi:hypothetical protein DL771_007138 [Monosporascus sp. 5C6A]|nr:hypothetical protein DL771_007138 [Monosporascus sp. 5C6A]
MDRVISLKEVSKESSEEHPAAADGLIDDASELSEDYEGIDGQTGGGGGVLPSIEKSYTGTPPGPKPRPVAQGIALHIETRHALPPGRISRASQRPTTDSGQRVASTRPPDEAPDPLASRDYDQPAPPPPFPFPPGTSSRRAPHAASNGPAGAPPPPHLPHQLRRPTTPWAAGAYGQPAQPPPPDPFKPPVRRRVLPPHHDWHARGRHQQQPAPSTHSDYGPEPARLRDIRAADGGGDEPMQDTASAGTRVERRLGEEIGTGSDGQGARSGGKSANANAYRD